MTRSVTGTVGASDGLTFLCPKGYSAVAAGFETDQPGLALAAMSPAFKNGSATARCCSVGTAIDTASTCPMSSCAL